MKRATSSSSLRVTLSKISIHALVKRATLAAFARPLFSDISIHALVKRATSHFAFIAFQLVISIHALVKRATTQNKPEIRITCYFNPRPREEGDAIGNTSPWGVGISIHALVKRATDLFLKIVYSLIIFQSTPS